MFLKKDFNGMCDNCGQKTTKSYQPTKQQTHQMPVDQDFLDEWENAGGMW